MTEERAAAESNKSTRTPTTFHVSAYRLALALVLLAGIALRFWGLGEPGLYGNEDYVALASSAIHEAGVPIFPSGQLYPRALIYSYLVAGTTLVLGNGDAAMRIVGAVSSVLILLATYVVARRAFGRGAALIAVTVMSFSSWELSVGHTARMYAPFSAAFVLTLVAATSRTRSRWAMRALPLIALITVTLHQVGAVLVPVLFVLWLFSKTRGAPDRALLVAILFAAFGSAGTMAFENTAYRSWDHRVRDFHGVAVIEITPAEAGGNAGPERGRPYQSRTHIPTHPGQVANARASVSRAALFAPIGKPGNTASQQHAGTSPWSSTRFRPYFPIAFGALTGFPGGAILGLILVFTITGAGMFGLANGKTHDPMFAGAVALAGGLVAVQQLPTAAYVAALYWVGSAWLGRNVNRRLGVLALLLVLGAALWGSIGLATGFEPRQVVTLLKRYPPNFLELLFRKEPGITIGALATIVWLVTTIRVRTATPAAVAVLAVILIPPTVLGFHPLAMDRFFERYVFIVNPMLVMAFAAMVWALAVRSCHRLRIAPGGSAAPVILTLALLFLSGAVRPAATISAISMRYGPNPGLTNAYGAPVFVSDLRGAAMAACRLHEAGDTMVFVDILGASAYCPEADYQLGVSEKADGPGWFGVPTLNSVDQVATMARTVRAQRVVFVTDAWTIDRHRGEPETERLIGFLRGPCTTSVYEGLDGGTSVIVWEPGCDDT